MKNAFLLAFALAIGTASMVQATYAATNEPAAMSSEQMKTKPVKKAAPHKHERHSHLKVHRAHRAA
jgi:hypothetical protein